MALRRYPADVTSYGSYLLFKRREFKGAQFNSAKLFEPADFKFTELATLKDMMALPLPNQVIDQTSVVWNDDISQNIAESLSGKAISIGNQWSGWSGSSVGRVTGDTESKVNLITYEGTSIKGYNFVWKMIPYTKEEADGIENIISIFEYSMLRSEGGTAGTQVNTVPDLWNIKAENVNRLKFLPCAITDVSVNLAPNGIIQVMSDGNLPAYELSVTFKEVVDRTKQIYSKLKDGREF